MNTKFKFLVLSVIFSASIYGDVQNEPLKLGIEEFKEYFSYELYENVLLLNLSPSFVQSFEERNCSFHGSIVVYDTETETVPEESVVYGISIQEVSLQTAMKQQLYATGFGNELSVSLRYSLLYCSTLKNKTGTQEGYILFDIDDIGKLKK